MKLKIKPDGTITAVYDDRLPLERLGTFTIARASHVEFNPESQKWEARDDKGVLMCSDRNREKCLQLEKAFVEARL